MTLKTLHPTHYAVFNSHIDSDKNLSPSLKLLFSRLAGLAKLKGYCYATNQYLADRDNCTVRATQYKLQTLIKLKYIRCENHLNPETGQTERRIFITKQYANTDGVKKGSQGGEKRKQSSSSKGGEIISPYNKTNSILNPNPVGLDSRIVSSCELDVSVQSRKPSQKRKRKRKPIDERATRDVESIFTYWKEKLVKPRSELNASRIGKISARLKQGYSVDELKLAIDGVFKSDWHMGRNGTPQYNDFRTIFRDDGQVDKFIMLAKAKEPEKVTERVIVDGFATCKLCEAAPAVGRPCPVHGGRGERK